jgi:hypothetical protein
MIIVDFSDGRVPTPRPVVLNDLNRLRVAVAAAGWIDEGLKGSVIAAPVPAAGIGAGIVAWTIG